MAVLQCRVNNRAIMAARYEAAVIRSLPRVPAAGRHVTCVSAPWSHLHGRRETSSLLEMYSSANENQLRRLRTRRACCHPILSHVLSAFAADRLQALRTIHSLEGPELSPCIRPLYPLELPRTGKMVSQECCPWSTRQRPTRRAVERERRRPSKLTGRNNWNCMILLCLSW